MSLTLTKGQSIFISAGEFSGDLLAGELIHCLQREFPNDKIFGITGPTMELAGAHAIAKMDELSVMGIIEVARKACDIRLLEQRIFTWVDRLQPRFAVLVDFPGFHFRLAEQLKMRGIPVFQYVAPKVWAWGKGRLPALCRDFTKVLGVLPFEDSFFKEHGVNYEYVGSPHWDRMSKLEVCSSDLGFPTGTPIVAFLPGSRVSELTKILPEMVRIRSELAVSMPEAICVIPLAPSLSWDEVANVLNYSGLIEKQAVGFDAAGFRWLAGWSLELMKIARVAVVASGTATLECALAGTPMVVIYVMNELSFLIAKRAVSIKWASLVNLLMNEEVVKEHLQVIDAPLIASQVKELSQESIVRRQMIAKFEELASRLQSGAASRAARVIRETMGL